MVLIVVFMVLSEAWSKVDSVILDSYHGSICGVNFLADMGHRYIALVNAPPEASGSYEERMGYLDTIQHDPGSDDSGVHIACPHRGEVPLILPRLEDSKRYAAPVF